jgi:flagellar protein FlbD
MQRASHLVARVGDGAGHAIPASGGTVIAEPRAMIKLHRLNGSSLVVNALLIERIESAPDTIIRLTTGNQYVVRETSDEVRDLAVQFLRSIRCGDSNAPLGQLARVMR